MKYQQALVRILNPKKYALYRTTPLRYIFLHLLLLSMILAAPAATGFFHSMSSLSQLIEEKANEIPEFTVKNAHLILPLHQDKTIHLKQGTVTFTEKPSGPASDIFTFSRDKIHISGIDPISYHNISTITDRPTLLSTLSTFTSSVYFYFILVCLALILIQLTLLLIKLVAVSLGAHLTAQLLKRKSRYMNWLKITAFVMTIPVLIQYIGLLIPNTLTYPLSWCIIIVLTCLALYHLPVITKRVKP